MVLSIYIPNSVAGFPFLHTLSNIYYLLMFDGDHSDQSEMIPHSFDLQKWQPTPILLPGKSRGWRSLVGYSPWGGQESDTTERLPFHFSLSCIRERNGNPLQYSCLENPRDGGAWWAAVYGVAQSWTRLKRQQQQRQWQSWAFFHAPLSHLYAFFGEVSICLPLIFWDSYFFPTSKFSFTPIRVIIQ